MYILLMKAREEEFKVAKNMNSCFSDDIIPLFEIIDDSYKKRYKVDESGNFIYFKKTGAKRQSRVTEEPTEGDIITLDKINNLVNNKKVFIDYFRFDPDRYGTNLDLNRIKLSVLMNQDKNLYLKKICSIERYKNMIPVLSLKSIVPYEEVELLDIIEILDAKFESIAIRVEYDLLDRHKNIIINTLRQNDYLLFDINETSYKYKDINYEELDNLKVKCNKVLLNSPRSRDIENRSFGNNVITKLIDNSVVIKYKQHNFDGFGDYGGLADQLPKTHPKNNVGSALSLLYSFENNSFYSFCNKDTSLAQRGYKNVINDVLLKETLLNPKKICKAYLSIHKMNDSDSFRDWKKWKGVTLTRYLDQIYQAMKTGKL